MMSDNTIGDLFICGKCHANFTDLNLFLTHRTDCNTQTTSHIYATTTDFLQGELDAIIQDVSMTIPRSTNMYYEQPSVEVQPPPSTIATTNVDNNFDLLFSQPVQQDTRDNLSIENGISQMNLLECPVCDEHFDAPTVLENHVFEHSTWADEDSNLHNEESSSSYTDLIDEPPSIPLECKQCTVTFSSNASLHMHKRMIHCLNPIFRCLNDACAQLFERPVDYILHARIHSQKRHVITSSRRSAYNRRRKRTYRCRICKTSFPSSEQLQNHTLYETHKFLCQLCPAEFDTNNSYHNHVAQHSDLALYRCKICIESFQKRNDLSRHIITKHNEQIPNQKSCTACKLTFKTTFHLNRHNVTKHSDVKPFKCEQDGCEQAFARKDKLKQHAAKHTAAGGLFKCHACVKTFVRPEHLRDHDIVRHSHQYPFSCEVCRKGFLHQNQLYAHHKQRHANDNYEFPSCDYVPPKQDFFDDPQDFFLESQ